MAANSFYCLITMQKSPGNKNQHPFNQFFAFIQGFLFHKFLTMISCVNTFFLSHRSFVQSQFESCESRNWDEKSQDFKLCSKQASCNEKKHDDESLSRDQVETVMTNLTLFCSPEGEELPQKVGSRELSRLFEEKEPSLEEVKDAFDVFDENKDGFIDALELQRVLCILGMKEGFQLENCKKMIKTFDENGDGRIDFKEFVKFMESSFVES
ncbi:probable calcium-binding protein CML46 [Citrus sinensis]|uniref:probable calcium-binding protein CML46 n=1 Tax=Citrus sinensis TaxID=2711 RepID=UPI00227997AC|nr:probable calcium-binding protein CML46 [Citrus sinensis]